MVWRDSSRRLGDHAWPSCGRRTRPRSRSAPAAQPATKLETAGYFADSQQPRPRRKPGRNATVGEPPPWQTLWPGRGHGYPIARSATAHHTIPGANLQKLTSEPSPGLLPQLRCLRPSPEALPAVQAPPLPMPVASVAALRTAGGSGRRRGAGSPQVGLNGVCPRLRRAHATRDSVLLWLSRG